MTIPPQVELDPGLLFLTFALLGGSLSGGAPGIRYEFQSAQRQSTRPFELATRRHRPKLVDRRRAHFNR